MTATAGKTKVLEITGTLYVGGAEHVVVNLARGAERTRFEVAVCCTQGRGPLADELETDGIAVYGEGSDGRLKRYLAVRQLYRVMTSFAPDVIHTHGLPAMLEVWPLALLRLTPRWIHTFHFGNYPYALRRYMLAERLSAHAADSLVAVSEGQRDALVRYHRLAPERILVLPNGVPDNRFRGDASVRLRKRAELDLAVDAPVVGSIAVLTEQKGMTYLLRAAQAVLQRRPDARFVIVGGGPLEAQLRREAEGLGVAHAVIFTGWRADVAQILLAFDVFVMASLWEAMPLTLLEAMAAGRAVVVTDVGDNRRIVQDGRAGLVVPPRDAPAIAEAVLRLLEGPRAAADLGQVARERFDACFSVSRMMAGYERLFAGGDPADGIGLRGNSGY